MTIDNKKRESLRRAFENELFEDAVKLGIKRESISASMIERYFNVGYAKAAQLLELMEECGFIGEREGSLAREMKINAEEWRSIRYEICGVKPYSPPRSDLLSDSYPGAQDAVALRELIESEKFKGGTAPLICLGKDAEGNPVIADITTLPHLLIAGTTGSGKSVMIAAILMSLLYKCSPEELKLILIDTKRVEFCLYNEIPHMLVPPLTDIRHSLAALEWACEEMERRYALMAGSNVRRIDDYNRKIDAKGTDAEKLPRIVIVIDELADIMMCARAETERLIVRLAQRSRAAGIHLIISTQRPSVDVITGIIAANIPSRIAAKTVTGLESKLLVGVYGAERISRRGDMLFSPVGSSCPIYVKGAFICEGDICDVTEYLRDLTPPDAREEWANNLKRILEISENMLKASENAEEDDEDEEYDLADEMLRLPLFREAVNIALTMGKISTSMIQRKLSIGYGKAAKMIDAMEQLEIIGEKDGPSAYPVLISRELWDEFIERYDADASEGDV